MCIKTGISSLFFTKSWTILESLLTHSQTRFGPGTSQPENVFGLRNRPIGNAPETLYTAGQGFSGGDVIDARSCLNHSWDLYLKAMGTARAERTLRLSAAYVDYDPWNSLVVMFHIVYSHAISVSIHARNYVFNIMPIKTTHAEMLCLWITLFYRLLLTSASSKAGG